MLYKTYNSLNFISRVLVIMLFIYTGFSKLITHGTFLKQLGDTPFKEFALMVSIFIPVMEIGIGILLSIQKTEMTGWWFASILLSIFTIYIASMLVSKSQLPCTCGGVIASLSWNQHLILNISFLVMSWFQLYYYYFIKKFSTNTKEVS